MPTLEVRIGPDRLNTEPARLNDTRRPHEIDTEHFTGRVLVRILNAPGAKEGEEGMFQVLSTCGVLGWQRNISYSWASILGAQ